MHINDGLKAKIDRELKIIAADCADPHAGVGCDKLTLAAVGRLADHVSLLADCRKILNSGGCNDV